MDVGVDGGCYASTVIVAERKRSRPTEVAGRDSTGRTGGRVGFGWLGRPGSTSHWTVEEASACYCGERKRGQREEREERERGGE